MKEIDLRLQRLLRAAAATSHQQAVEMPYGFDTRVLARARAGRQNDLVAVGRLLRRVVWISLGVIVLASAGAYHELQQSEDLGASLTDEYVITDSALGGAFEP